MTTDNHLPNSPKPEINWDIGKRILIKEDVLDPKLCDEIIEFGKENVVQGVNKYSHLFGISFHACLLPLENEVHKTLQGTWKEVIDFFNMDISFVEPYELKRYTSDDYFGRHMDNYYSLTVNLDRKITMSVQLSDTDEYEGGEFNILGVKSKLKKGSIVSFPSFFPHEIESIKSGTRWSLIGWAWGPYWK